MRLVCPNCDAEYEVDTSAIPETGRDVQCSNCGHAWFQMSPSVEEELAAEEALFEPPPPLSAPEFPAAISVENPAEEDEDGPEGGPESPPLPPRSLDESLMAVLREEAERETTARRAEAPVMETQAELGLSAAIAETVAAAAAPEPEPEPDPVAARIARMKGETPAPAKPVSRRDMLPEIDEINSTLRPSGERRGGEAGAVSDGLAGRQGGASFRTGFVLMILLALAIVALYVMAPKLAEQIPAAKGGLEAYVAAIDSLRLWLDGLLRSATGAMGGKAP